MKNLRELIVAVCVWMLVIIPMSTAFAAIDGLFHMETEEKHGFVVFDSKVGGTRHTHASGMIHTHPIYNYHDRLDFFAHYSDTNSDSDANLMDSGLASGGVASDTIDSGSSVLSITLPVDIQCDSKSLFEEVYILSEIPHKLVSALIPTELRPPIAML